MSTPANPLTPQQPPAQQGVFGKIGLVLPGIANRLAAAFGNYRPLQEEQRQQQLTNQTNTANSENALRGSQLETNALTRQHLQQTIANNRSPEQEAELRLGTEKKIHALKPPESEIDTDSSGNLIRNEFNSDTQKWSPRTHEVPNPALDQYSNPSAPKPNYVQDWNAGPPPSMPKTVPEAVHPLPPAPMLGVTYGPTVQDENGNWVQSVRNKMAQQQGTVPIGGTPVAAMPTTSYSSTNKVEKDVNNNLVNVPETSVNTRVRGNGNAPRPPFPNAPHSGAATPIMGQDGNQLHAPLGADAKKNISQISTTQKMIDGILPELEARIKQSGGDMNSLWDAGAQRLAWAEYNRGGVIPDNVDPVLAHLLPTIAQLKIVGGLPYLRGTRSFQYIQQIQQHLPDPEKDSPALMVDKIRSLQRTMPILRQSVMESEGVNAPPAGPPTPPVPGAIDPKNPLGL